MATLSVVISAYNEEKNIEDCLKSAAFADEIIVVDNSSTDKTAELSKRYTKKIFSRPNNPMLNINKNFGFSKATGDWILSLDADERVTDSLKEEIKSQVTNPSPRGEAGKSQISGFKIRRKNIIFGKWIEHTGWYPDYQLRLFKKGKGKFAEKHVHEMIEIDGEIGTLDNPMEHYNYQTVSQFIDKMNRIYTPNEAENLLKNGYKFDWLDVVRFPTKEFLSRYFAREGYKDGLHGLALSLLMAFYHLVVFLRIWEEKGFEEVSEEEVAVSLSKEGRALGKEFIYWVKHVRKQSAKSMLGKLAARFL